MLTAKLMSRRSVESKELNRADLKENLIVEEGMLGVSRLRLWNLPVRSLARAMSSSHKPALKGIVFDMDGTLTVPCIDFRLMYRRVLGEDHPKVVNGSPIDILHEISSWNSEKQVLAYSIITDMEREANERLQIMPGAQEICQFLDSQRIRRGLITRNVQDSVAFFHSRFGLNKFEPALSREFTPCKPSPAALLHICNAWGVQPSEVMMVGDSAADDVVCGNRAGALTCLLDETQRYRLSELPSEQQPTYVIKTLFEINSILENFELLPVTDGDHSSISDDVSAFRVQEAS